MHREELLVTALLAKLALVHHEDSVGALNCGEAVRDEDGCSPGNHSLKREPHAELCLRVDRAGRFIENQNAWSVRQRTCEADQLLLSCG